MDRDKMSNLCREPSIDASYQVLVHLAKRFQRRRFFEKSTYQKQELFVVAMFVNRLGQNFVQSLYEDFPQMLPTKFRIIQPCGFREEDYQKQTNQKQESSVVAMFVNGSGRNEQSLQRTFHRCFLSSFGSFGHVVSEEKIFLKQTNQKQESPVAAMFVNEIRTK